MADDYDAISSPIKQDNYDAISSQVASAPKHNYFATKLGEIGDAGRKYVSDLGTTALNAAKQYGSAYSANPFKNAAGTLEAGLNIGTGMVSAPLNLIRKIVPANTPLGLKLSQVSDEEFKNAMTYHPSSAMGQAIPAVVGATTAPVNDVLDLGARGISAVTPFSKDTVRDIMDTALLGEGIRATRAGAAPVSTTEAATRAQNYVGSNTSLDWSRLPQAARDRLTQIAKDQQTLDLLDPKAVERQLQLESLPVPIKNATKGQLTRDPRQLQQEELLKSTSAGDELTQGALAQNRAINQNIDVLRNQTGGAPKSDLELGRQIQDQNLRAKQQSVKAVVKSAFDEARAAGEMRGPVDIKLLQDWLDNPTNRRNAPYLDQAIKDYAKEDGAISINDLEEIRREASDNTQSSDGATRLAAGRATRVIDDILDQAGGNLYRKARALHRAERTEFGDQASVESLVENKTRTDRQTALEDTYHKTVISGSVDSLQQVIDSLTKGGTPETQARGAQAIKDLAATTIENIKQEATRGASNQAGEANSTYARLKAAIDRVGDDKLNLLIGKESTAQLRQVLQAAETLKTEPTGINVRGSNTVNKIMNILDRSLVGKIPGIGNVAVGTIKAAEFLKDLGKNSREVSAAQKTPLTAAEEQAANKLKGNQPRNKLKAIAAADAASEGRD